MIESGSERTKQASFVGLPRGEERYVQVIVTSVLLIVLCIVHDRFEFEFGHFLFDFGGGESVTIVFEAFERGSLIVDDARGSLPGGKSICFCPMRMDL